MGSLLSVISVTDHIIEEEGPHLKYFRPLKHGRSIRH